MITNQRVCGFCVSTGCRYSLLLSRLVYIGVHRYVDRKPRGNSVVYLICNVRRCDIWMCVGEECYHTSVLIKLACNYQFSSPNM